MSSYHYFQNHTQQILSLFSFAYGDFFLRNTTKKKKKKPTRIVVYTKIQNYLREKIGICYNKIAFLEKALQGFLVSLGKGVFAWF